MKEKKYIDLGLPSGTLWASKNEKEYYTCDFAVATFGDNLPAKEQMEELIDVCVWKWDNEKKGYKVVGTNGNSIFLPATGCRSCNGSTYFAGSCGSYWSYTPDGSSNAWYLSFNSSGVEIYYGGYGHGLSVRLVKNKNANKINRQ